MSGNIVAVCISKSKGERKQPVARVELREDHGIVGDGHAGDWHRQVSLLASESIQKMRDLGLSVSAGDFAENLTTIGINLVELPIGTRLQVGETILEVTQIGKECHTRCAIYYQAGDCVMPKEGIFARVITGGTIMPGSRIEVITAKAAATAAKEKENMARKNKENNKKYVISMRLNDDEMAGLQELMNTTNQRASDLMRQAYQLFRKEAAQSLTIMNAG